MKRTYKQIVSAALMAVAFSSAAAGQERQDSTVTMPWNQPISYWQTTGSWLSVKGSKLEDKPVGDLRNRLTGVIPGLDVMEVSGGLMPSGWAYNTLNNDEINMCMRGSSNLMCIVDDMYIPFSQILLDPNQVESITVLADIVDMARFGPLASNGALLIRTKSAGYNTPMRIKVDLESGISAADRVSEWVNGVEYARMNNYARAAAGYNPQYSPYAIEEFAKGDAYSLKYPNVDYKSLMYKNMYPVSRAGVNINGGGNTVKYNFSLAGLYSGDLVNGGPVTDYSQFNITAGVAAKVGKYIEVSVNFSSLLSFRRQNRVSWNNYRSVPAVAFPLVLGTVENAEDGELGTTIYGVSRTFTQNYYALMKEGGYSTARMRSGVINAAVDVDMSWLLKGLKSRTWLSTYQFVQTTIGKTEDYLAYYWAPDTGQGDISTHKAEKASGKSTEANWTNQSLAMYERLSYGRQFGRNNIAAGATFSLNSTSNKYYSQPQKQMYALADVSYSYDKRYIAEVVAQYAGSYRYARSHRFGFFPSAGLAWVASNEKFLRNAGWMDNLKLRAQAGLVGQTNVFDAPYLYRADYSFGSGIWYGPLSAQSSWFGSNRWTSQKTTINRLANRDLGWPTKFQAEAGVDFGFIGKFTFSATAYYGKEEGTIADIASAVPEVFGLSGTSLYDNWSSNSTRGVDLSFTYNQAFGDFRLLASASASTWRVRYDKLVSDDYIYDYQKQTGSHYGDIWGFRCIGKYTTAEQIETVPSYSSVEIGDLMYEDVNNDGVIDVNDKVIIGNSVPKLFYTINLGFGWKNLDVNLTANGRALMDASLTNAYFWNGWGDGNYSAFVRDNLGVDYPRLSYVKSENNFVLSDFWLRKGGWFKIQDIEVAYTLPFRKGNRIGISSIRFSVKGQNLATVSGIKDVDPESMDAGVSAYPLMKTVTGGIKFTF